MTVILRLAIVAALALGIAVPAASGAPAPFRTPSGNIHCYLGNGSGGTVQCWVMSRACRGEYGTFAYSWAMSGRQRPMRFCPGDLVRGTRVLGYGRSVSVGQMTCRSQQRGLTCTNRRTGRGFFLSRERQRIF